MELGSPLSCAQYVAIYSCCKTTESILCLPNLYGLKICCNAFLPFMPSLQSGFLTSGFQLYVCITHLSIHSSFPSHLILLYFSFVFFLVLQLLTYCFCCQIWKTFLLWNLRYWNICSGIVFLCYRLCSTGSAVIFLCYRYCQMIQNLNNVLWQHSGVLGSWDHPCFLMSVTAVWGMDLVVTRVRGTALYRMGMTNRTILSAERM